MNWTGLGALAYLVIFVVTAMGWRSYVVWRKTGVNPYKLGTSQSAHDYVGRCFRIVIAGILVMTAAYAFFPAVHDLIHIQGWPQRNDVTLFGFVLMTVALGWVLVAQAQMGASWRIGIDNEHATALVQRGLFRFSRNPIFLGMRISLLGLLLALPNAASLALCLLGEVLIQIQVRLEEEHLARLHGAAYDDYRQRTRRWI